MNNPSSFIVFQAVAERRQRFLGNGSKAGVIIRLLPYLHIGQIILGKICRQYQE
jgi:hypothetical protein